MKKTLLITALLASCLFPAAPASPASLTREGAVWYRLHFGTGAFENAPLPEKINRFIDTVVTENFPEDFTIVLPAEREAARQFGPIRERILIVDIQCDDTDDNWLKVRGIADNYVKTFREAKANCFIKRIPGITTIFYRP